MKPVLYAAASRRHKDKFSANTTLRRGARSHFNSLGSRRLGGCAMAQPYQNPASHGLELEAGTLIVFCNNDVNVRLTSFW